MESRHIRIDYDDAIASKKQLLNSEINALEIAKRIKNYQLLRKKEIVLKNELKNHMTFLGVKISGLLDTLPETYSRSNSREKKNSGKIKESKDFNQELEDIKRRLEALG